MSAAVAPSYIVFEGLSEAAKAAEMERPARRRGHVPEKTILRGSYCNDCAPLVISMIWFVMAA